ncbi:MAG: hypothetical protein AAF721_18960 [Myxococcota bacterium]
MAVGLAAATNITACSSDDDAMKDTATSMNSGEEFDAGGADYGGPEFEETGQLDTGLPDDGAELPTDAGEPETSNSSGGTGSADSTGGSDSSSHGTDSGSDSGSTRGSDGGSGSGSGSDTGTGGSTSAG